MNEKSKSLFNIKFYLFILLSLIYHFCNDMNPFNELLNEIRKYDTKIDIRNNRVLAKYKQDKDLTTSRLKENMAYNTKYEKNDIYNNTRGNIRKNKNSNKNLLNKTQYCIEVLDYNNGMFDGKHFHFEKKWIKKKDYDNYVERNRRICDIALKKIKFKSYGFGIVLFILFFLVGIGLPILRVFDFDENSTFTPFKTLWKFIYEDSGLKAIIEVTESQAVVGGVAGVQYFYLVTYVLLIIILAILLILAIPKILRNNEKYKKIKYISE
ncbi:fam-m protein [Plasmodium malariae]|uniref:Fam-m protein n=1 Tax=Plasmodium malariae TaxID=5858 RepID=A0A1D3JHW0_PLAMA|nr:fam-m protein [Plasmodium malariae]SBT85996.1 fam-m protein [Plasmodium malariae]